MAGEASNDSQRPSVPAVRCRLLRSPSIPDHTRLLDLVHACLNVDEIVRCINCELVESKVDVIAVVLECYRKKIEDPVPYSLWETQKTLIPLLKALPGDIWDGGGRAMNGSTCTPPSSDCLIWTSFRRLPTPLEWVHFWGSTQKMRWLRIAIWMTCRGNDNHEGLVPARVMGTRSWTS